jgi:hypothetical protein
MFVTSKSGSFAASARSLAMCGTAPMAMAMARGMSVLIEAKCSGESAAAIGSISRIQRRLPGDGLGSVARSANTA